MFKSSWLARSVMVVMIVAMLGLVAGAEEESAAQKENATKKEAAGAKSPDAAARQFVEALKSQDRKAYDAVMAPSDLADSVFKFAVAAESFKAKMLKAYGEVGWQNFQDPDGARISLAYNDDLLKDLKFEVEGDTAKGNLPDEKETLIAIRKGERWQIDLTQTFDSKDEEGSMTAESMAKAMSAMASTLRDHESKIGEGTTVDQLDKELGAAFLSALVAAGAKPKVSVQVR